MYIELFILLFDRGFHWNSLVPSPFHRVPLHSVVFCYIPLCSMHSLLLSSISALILTVFYKFVTLTWWQVQLFQIYQDIHSDNVLSFCNDNMLTGDILQ